MLAIYSAFITEALDVAMNDAFGFIDNAHAADAELFQGAVVGDGLPYEGRGVRHLAHMLGCRLMDADLVAEMQVRFGAAQ